MNFHLLNEYEQSRRSLSQYLHGVRADCTRTLRFSLFFQLLKDLQPGFLVLAKPH